jgi:D-alanyl-D-alanine carboxypeptidase
MTNTKDVSSQLQAALEAAVESPDTTFPGTLLCVRSPEFGPWRGAAGLGEVETGTAMRPDDKFRAGSVMKPFVAVAVLQLVEGGRFSLDDPLPAVLPDSVTVRFAASDEITVRMLLNHSSGIPDWLTDAAIAEIGANPARVRHVDEYLQLAAVQEPYFPPGQGFTYSNTDYNLLGLLIERATGRSWREEVRQRVIEPLHLEDTLLPEPGDLSIPGNYAHGYMDMGAGLLDLSQVDPSMAGAAGGHALVATTMDLARFLDAVLAGDLFQEAATLDEMLTLVDTPEGASPSGLAVGYGLGVMKYVLPGDIEMLGHAGGTAGYQCFVYNLPAQGIVISGAMTSMQSDEMQFIFPALEILIG